MRRQNAVEGIVGQSLVAPGVDVVGDAGHGAVVAASQVVAQAEIQGRACARGGLGAGVFEAGVVARLLGASLSVVIGGFGCLAAVGFTVLMARNLLHYEYTPHEHAELASG